MRTLAFGSHGDFALLAGLARANLREKRAELDALPAARAQEDI